MLKHNVELYSKIPKSSPQSIIQRLINCRSIIQLEIHMQLYSIM